MVMLKYLTNCNYLPRLCPIDHRPFQNLETFIDYSQKQNHFMHTNFQTFNKQLLPTHVVRMFL